MSIKKKGVNNSMNKRCFSAEQVKDGELVEFINILIKQSYGKSTEYADIHIQPSDLGGVILEWEDAAWNKEYGGHWQYIKDDDNEVVMKCYYFPDDHTELLESDEEYKEALNNWLEEHKEEGWYKNELNHWVSKKEQEEWQKYIK